MPLRRAGASGAGVGLSKLSLMGPLVVAVLLLLLWGARACSNGLAAAAAASEVRSSVMLWLL